MMKQTTGIYNTGHEYSNINTCKIQVKSSSITSLKLNVSFNSDMFILCLYWKEHFIRKNFKLYYYPDTVA